MKITEERFREMTQQMKFLGSFKHIGTWDEYEGYLGYGGSLYVKYNIYNVYFENNYVNDEGLNVDGRYIFYDIKNKRVISEEAYLVWRSKDGKELSRHPSNVKLFDSCIEEHFRLDLKSIRILKLQKIMEEHEKNI